MHKVTITQTGIILLPLNPNKLAEIIEKILKGAKLSEFYTIRKMSKQGEAFLQIG